MAVYGKAQWVAKNIIELDTFRATQITTSRLSIYAIKKKKKKHLRLLEAISFLLSDFAYKRIT